MYCRIQLDSRHSYNALITARLTFSSETALSFQTDLICKPLNTPGANAHKLSQNQLILLIAVEAMTADTPTASDNIVARNVKTDDGFVRTLQPTATYSCIKNITYTPK